MNISQLQRVLNTSSVTLLSFSPVNDLPDPLNIASLVVQVLQVTQLAENTHK
jgi:hypothetical protein